MCKLLEEMRDETALENAKDNAVRMLKTGRISLEDIAYSTNLSIETVKKLKEDMLQMA